MSSDRKPMHPPHVPVRCRLCGSVPRQGGARMLTPVEGGYECLGKNACAKRQRENGYDADLVVA